jgi:hypothetical protein
MILSLDLETHLIDRGRLAPAPVSASWADPGGSGLDLIADAMPRIEAWLRDDDDIIIGANIAFDMGVLGEHYPHLLPRIFEKYAKGLIQDIQINQKIIDIASKGATADKNSLEALCERYGLVSPDKSGPWRTEFSALASVPVHYWPQGARDYVLGDAKQAFNIYHLQQLYAKDWEKASGFPLLHLAPREAEKAFALHLISCWGLHTDAGRVEILRKRLDDYLSKAGRILRRMGWVRKDGTRDTKAVQAAMERYCLAHNLRVPRTETGKVCLNKEAAFASGSRLLQTYSDYSQTDTLLSRVEDLAEGVELPLQVRFDTLLETSRVSTSKPSPPLVGVQAQNFPRDLAASVRPKKGEPWVPGARECLEPRPGHLFVSCDLPSAELRSLAQVNVDLFGASSMADQLNAGRDLHLWFAAQMLGLDYEEAKARFADGDKAIKTSRQNAKACNFGFPGGMGVVNFIRYSWATYRVRLDEATAKRLKGVWLAAFPEMARYFQWINQKFDGKDKILHRHIRSGRFRGALSYCGACNTNFQELTANAASGGLIEVQREAYTHPGSYLYGARVVMYTHDEIVMEVTAEGAHRAALVLSHTMADAFNKWHPDVQVVGALSETSDPRVIQPCVSRIYSKDMHGVWVDGKLGVWTPEGSSFEAPPLRVF